MKITKVYTRTGDKGMTDLIGGERISKADPRLEAYGTTDELSAHIGLLVAMMERDSQEGADRQPLDQERQLLLRAQDNLFVIGSNLATNQATTPLYDFAKLPDTETAQLEERIDHLMAILPQKQGFILPGGTVTAAQCHVCRTVCRRAERAIYRVAEEAEVDATLLRYVNRLSDYFFALAKQLNHIAGHEESYWKARS